MSVFPGPVTGQSVATVTGYVPGGVLGAVVNVSVEVAAAWLSVAGAKDAVAPGGRPPTVRPGVPANPVGAKRSTVVATEPPGTTPPNVDVSAIEKSQLLLVGTPRDTMTMGALAGGNSVPGGMVCSTPRLMERQVGSPVVEKRTWTLRNRATPIASSRVKPM